MNKCQRCNGSGMIRRTELAFTGAVVSPLTFYGRCHSCGGKGRTESTEDTLVQSRGTASTIRGSHGNPKTLSWR